MLAPVVEIFCDIDGFCKRFLPSQNKCILPNLERQRDRNSQMSLSEVATINVLFQMSHKEMSMFVKWCRSLHSN